MKFLILAFALLGAANAWSWPWSWPDFTKWSGLRVTWGARPGWALDKLPRSLEQNDGEFVFKDDQCAAGGGKFVGQRYWYKQDPALILIYDKNGIIAGIQTSNPKSKYTPVGGMTKYYVDDGDYWTLTAYFVDPSTVCTKGRSKDDLSTDKNGGTGTGLWLQYGPDAIKDSISIPMKEEDVKKTNWGHGKCFISMGQHYWYNISAGMDCNEIAPNCLLYNKGVLTGFCFANNALLDSSRYDWPAPTIDVLKKFLDPVPTCMHTDPNYQKQSTLHVFFASIPEFTSWC